MFLRIKNYKNYDWYYIKLSDADTTWKNVLNYIEGVFDDQYIENGDKIEGCHLTIEIVKDCPEDIEKDCSL